MKQDVVINQKQDFTISANLKKFAAIAAIVGLVFFVIGFLTTEDKDVAKMRFWTSLLYNDLFFTWIAIAAGFFITAFGLGYSGWHTLIKRVPEAMGHFMFLGLPLILVVFLLGGKHIYEWTHSDIVSHDGFLKAKSWWLNTPTFIFFTILWIVTLCGFFWLVRKNSLKLDDNGEYKTFNKSFLIAAGFLFFFAVGNSVSTWHWVMSTEPHWYSTLYAWYLFASSLVSMVAVMVIVLALLKKSGYLPYVNVNHFHDLGKFLFAFSIFWTYLWFSQHMLIWYANIPEETIHFEKLYQDYPWLFWGSLILNFVIPLLTLMSRDAKRNIGTLIFVSVVILIGHWIDFFLMIRPGTDKLVTHGKHAEGFHGDIVTSIGLTEIGFGLFFLGIFAFIIAWALSKASLVPVNHPFERESIEHHI